MPIAYEVSLLGVPSTIEKREYERRTDSYIFYEGKTWGGNQRRDKIRTDWRVFCFSEQDAWREAVKFAKKTVDDAREGQERANEHLKDTNRALTVVLKEYSEKYGTFKED